MRADEEKREKWVQAKYEELEADGDNFGRSAEDLWDESHEAFDAMMDDVGDMEMEENREREYEED